MPVYDPSPLQGEKLKLIGKMSDQKLVYQKVCGGEAALIHSLRGSTIYANVVPLWWASVGRALLRCRGKVLPTETIAYCESRSVGHTSASIERKNIMTI
jgi:hypothetical protein